MKKLVIFTIQSHNCKKRSSQINRDLKDELINKLEEFITNTTNLKRFLKTQNKLLFQDFMKNYLNLGNFCLKELMEDKVYIQSKDEETNSDSETNALKEKMYY